MAFVPMIPHGGFVQQFSTQDLVAHAWQQIESRTLLPGALELAPFALQAQKYFVDACRADWRSGGLLFYYSFLNLSKVVLVHVGAAQAQQLRQSGAYHGLAAEQQTGRLLDFKIAVYAPRPTSGRLNLFALAYEALTQTAWPFPTTIQITLSDIVPYCRDIASELQTHFQVEHAIVEAYSMLRSELGESWFEVVVPSEATSRIVGEFQAGLIETVPSSQMTRNDAQDWLIAFSRTRQSLHGHDFLRSSRAPVGETLTSSAELYREHCVENVSCKLDAPWLFVPKIELNGVRLKWHPLLSDYLFSFWLSTVLRYQPYVLEHATVGQFLAEAWFRQAPLTMLRYFVASLTNPPIHLGRSD